MLREENITTGFNVSVQNLGAEGGRRKAEGGRRKAYRLLPPAFRSDRNRFLVFAPDLTQGVADLTDGYVALDGFEDPGQ